jgi:hypothetical protein
MFWGAKAAGDRDVFVAGNMQGSVMTFPMEAGEMADPPGVFTPPEETSLANEVDWSKYTGGESTETESTTAAATTEPTTTEPTTAEPTTEMPETMMPTETTEDSGSTPGFGALAAAGGIGLGAARLLADDSDDADAEE